MLILGLLLIALAALAIVGALFTSQGTVEFLGTDLGALTLFLLGLATGLAILLGLVLAKSGTKRSLRQRRENRKLAELSQKLDRFDTESRHDAQDHGDQRPTL